MGQKDADAKTSCSVFVTQKEVWKFWDEVRRQSSQHCGGERIEAERLPNLRRFWIRDQTGGPER
jgi:hypothetical protein